MTLQLGLALAIGSAAATNLGFLMRHRGASPLRTWTRAIRCGAPWGSSAPSGGRSGTASRSSPTSSTWGRSRSPRSRWFRRCSPAGFVLLGVFAERLFGFELGRREWVGIGLAAVGLAFLAVTGSGPSGQESSDYAVPQMIAFEAAMIGAGVALILSGRSGRLGEHRGIVLGISAGLLFTVAHVAVKALTREADAVVQVLASPFLWVAAACWVVAFFASGRSLQVGEAVAVIAVTSVASNASSIPAGVIVFGDPLGGDAPSVVARTVAFVMVVAAAALIPAPTRAGREQRRRAGDVAPSGA